MAWSLLPRKLMNRVSTEPDLAERFTRAVAPEKQKDATLDDEAKRALRVAAIVGPAFDAGVVARLLERPTGDVLEALQRCRDAGLAIVDRGAGRFRMPAAMQRGLVASTLPSLREQWSDRLAGLRGPSAVPAVITVEPVPTLDAEESLDVAAELLRTGDVRRARRLLRDLTTEIGRMDHAESGLLRARLSLERARLRWLGLGLESSFTLGAALHAAIDAHRALGTLAKPSLRANVAKTVAGIAYDLGDGASLETAVAIVREVRAQLVDEGAVDEAATLINDEASLELRMGRVAKARELLEHARATVAACLASRPDAPRLRQDLAETHHLLARLALHASDASEMAAALADADLAEHAFVELGGRRDVARVWETRARLAMKVGRFEDAEAAFRGSLRLADEIGDLIGLGRVTAGWAGLLVAQGEARQAVRLLTNSIELNRAKGSPVGLSYDERGLADLESAIDGTHPDRELAAALAAAKRALADALEATAT